MREGIIAKRLVHFESSSIKTFCIELTIFKRWCILFPYVSARPPINSTKVISSINAISKSLNNCDNIVLARELNIDLSDPSKDASDQLSDLLDVFDVKNLVQKLTFLKSKTGSLKCFILTNNPKV